MNDRISHLQQLTGMLRLLWSYPTKCINEQRLGSLYISCSRGRIQTCRFVNSASPHFKSTIELCTAAADVVLFYNADLLIRRGGSLAVNFADTQLKEGKDWPCGGVWLVPFSPPPRQLVEPKCWVSCVRGRRGPATFRHPRGTCIEITLRARARPSCGRVALSM